MQFTEGGLQTLHLAWLVTVLEALAELLGHGPDQGPLRAVPQGQELIRLRAAMAVTAQTQMQQRLAQVLQTLTEPLMVRKAELPFELEPEQVPPDPATDAVLEPLIQPV
jgi:hypothetical protein